METLRWHACADQLVPPGPSSAKSLLFTRYWESIAFTFLLPILSLRKEGASSAMEYCEREAHSGRAPRLWFMFMLEWPSLAGLSGFVRGVEQDLVPAQRTTDLILGHARFEEVLLFAQVHDFAHPGEGVLGAGVLLFQAELREAAVGDEVQVFFHHGGVHAQYAAGH